MPGLPSQLLINLKKTLLESSAFNKHSTLAALFEDARIKPWKNDIPEADSKKERVDLFVSAFINRWSKSGPSVLVLFLQVLHDEALEEETYQQRLNDLAIEVAIAQRGELPPLALNNLWRASAAQTGQALPAHLGGYAPLPLQPESGAPAEALPPALPASAFAESLESLKNKAKADWLPVSFLEKGLQAARAVGRVEQGKDKVGTAFLVAPNLVLTNAHVAEAIRPLTQGGVSFTVGLQGEVQWRSFVELVAGSPVKELDFALLRLDSPASGAPLSISGRPAYRDQPANILQHPGGDSMQVALRRNQVVYVQPTRLYYVTDTEQGSSGSPVFDDDWRLIALHRAGIVDDKQRPVKNANQGVPMTAIQPLIRPYL